MQPLRPARLRYHDGMRMELETAAGANLIRAYSPGRLVVGKQVVECSVVVTADRLLNPWPPHSFEELQPEDLQQVLELAPEVVLLGTGIAQRFPHPRLLAPFAAAGIGVEVMGTDAACRTYNILVSDGRRVAAALIDRKSVV